MSFEKPAIVIDNGSFSIKSGFACDNHPLSIFRNVVGRPKYLKGRYGREYYDVYVGDVAITHADDLDVNRPVTNGKIVHWDNMERIWHRIFYQELKAAPEDRAVVFLNSSKTSISDKLKCAEFFFETFNSPALCLQSQSASALYGSGVTTGICVDIGYDNANIFPVYEGGLISYAHIQTGLGGKQISEYIQNLLSNQNLEFGAHTPEVMETIIREYTYAPVDSKTNSQKCARYKLPNGEEIDICDDVFKAPDLIFRPQQAIHIESNILSLQEAVTTSALKCDSELRTELYDAIVLCGGISMIPGMDQRLMNEIENLNEDVVTLLYSSESYATTWLGGAVFASLPESKSMWVSQSQYLEYGEKILRKKFM